MPVWFVRIGPAPAVSDVVALDVDTLQMAARHCRVSLLLLQTGSILP